MPECEQSELISKEFMMNCQNFQRIPNDINVMGQQKFPKYSKNWWNFLKIYKSAKY